jgi:hypothetical protein
VQIVRLREIAVNCGLAFGGIIFALVIAEIGLRIAGVAYLLPTSFLQPDRDAGWAHRPAITIINPLEGLRGEVTFNRAGLRDDREFALSKPAGTLRIAVLGDSFTEALQVAEADDFCSIAERGLRQCAAFGGKKIEVLNFGVMGYGTGQELITLRRTLLRFSPNVVVLAFYTNDVADNTRATDAWERVRGASAGPRPFFTFDNGRLAEDVSFRDSPLFLNFLASNSWGPKPKPRSWIHHIITESRVWQVIHHFKFLQHVCGRAHTARSSLTNIHSEGASEPIAGVASDAADPFAIEAGVLGPPRDPQWVKAWNLTEALINEIRVETIAKGAKFLLAIVSDPLQVYPDAKFRERYFGGADEFYQNRRLMQLGARDGFDVLSLAKPMQRYADAHRIFLHGFAGGLRGWGHWNEAGHQLAGELIAAKICSMLSQSPPSSRTGASGH